MDDLGKMVVQEPRDDGSISRRLVVGEHDRHGRKRLELHTHAVAILEADGRIPAVVVDLPERSPIDDDARAALPNLVPLVMPLAGRQMAVQYRHEGLLRS